MTLANAGCARRRVSGDTDGLGALCDGHNLSSIIGGFTLGGCWLATRVIGNLTYVTVSHEEAEDIVRRGFEIVRLMNTTVMNGNMVGGRTATASMMPSQDSSDTHRLIVPITASSIVGNRSVLAFRQAVLAGENSAMVCGCRTATGGNRRFE